jgi:hypothetical protein
LVKEFKVQWCPLARYIPIMAMTQLLMAAP